MSIEILSILKKNEIMKFRSANSIVGDLHLIRTLKILVQHDLFFLSYLMLNIFLLGTDIHTTVKMATLYIYLL